MHNTLGTQNTDTHSQHACCLPESPRFPVAIFQLERKGRVTQHSNRNCTISDWSTSYPLGDGERAEDKTLKRYGLLCIPVYYLSATCIAATTRMQVLIFFLVLACCFREIKCYSKILKEHFRKPVIC